MPQKIKDKKTIRLIKRHRKLERKIRDISVEIIERAAVESKNQCCRINPITFEMDLHSDTMCGHPNKRMGGDGSARSADEVVETFLNNLKNEFGEENIVVNKIDLRGVNKKPH